MQENHYELNLHKPQTKKKIRKQSLASVKSFL